jgi:HPt (histidine-containing phosphotransfer) domain-containing protein
MAEWFDATVVPELRRMIGARSVREILSLFFENAPRRIEAVRAGLAEGDLDRVAFELHALKSSAGMLGALELQELAEPMERLARKRQADAVAAVMQRLAEAYARAESRLRSELARLEPGAQGDTD